MAAAEEIDDEADGLLDGLDGEARAERAELIAWLAERGITNDELRAAHERGTLVYAAASRLLNDGRRFSARELADRVNLDVAFIVALQRAQGFPVVADLDAPLYSEAQGEALETTRQFMAAGMSEEQVLATSRVLGHGLAQAARLMREQALSLALRPGTSERELAEAFEGASSGLVPLVGPMVQQLLRLHLDQAAGEEILTTEERAAGELPGAREVCVAFADLVGFTRMGEQLDPAALERVAARLVELTTDVVDAPVRFVKSVGDAVLLVCADPGPLLAASFALIAAVEAEGEDMPQVRIGVARGPAVTRAGDWIGRPVNLASRITTVARAGSVLATTEVKDAAPGDVATWSRAGERKLKGVQGAVRLHRARPAEPPA